MEKLIDRDNEMSSYMEEIETYKVVNDYSFNRNYKKITGRCLLQRISLNTELIGFFFTMKTSIGSGFLLFWERYLHPSIRNRSKNINWRIDF